MVFKHATHLPEHASSERIGDDILGLDPHDVWNVVRNQLHRDRVVRVTRDVHQVFEHLRAWEREVLVKVDAGFERPGANLDRTSIRVEWAGMFTLIHPVVLLPYPVCILKGTPIKGYSYGVSINTSVLSG